jgi:hypothetical protein
MLAGILSIALSLASLAASLVATGLWLRGRKALSRPVPPASVVIVLPVTERDPLEPGLLRTLVAADTGIPTRIRVAAGIMDDRNPRIYQECLARLPSADCRLDSVAVPAHQVPVAAIAMAVLREESADVAVFVDARSRPASRDPARLAASLGTGNDLVIPCPSPVPGGSIGDRMAGRALGDLVPLLRATIGPGGLPGGTAAVAMAALGPVFGDPMACNRATLGASVARHVPRGRSVLVPLPVGVLPARIRDMRAEILACSIRAEPVRVVWLLSALAALPFSMGALLFGPGPWLGVSTVSFLVALAARAILAGTWSRDLHGGGPALHGLFAAPLRDARAVGSLLAAIGGATRRIDGVSFRMRKGGILIPVDRSGDSET